MKSSLRGTRTLTNEITNINALGFWLLIENREYFVPFADYPAFKKATLDQILNLERIAPRQYRWEALDVDIELDALERPAEFPLIYHQTRRVTAQPSKRAQAALTPIAKDK